MSKKKYNVNDVKTYTMTFLTSILECCEYMCSGTNISLIIQDNTFKFLAIKQKSQPFSPISFSNFCKSVTNAGFPVEQLIYCIYYNLIVWLRFS